MFPTRKVAIQQFILFETSNGQWNIIYKNNRQSHNALSFSLLHISAPTTSMIRNQELLQGTGRNMAKLLRYRSGHFRQIWTLKDSGYGRKMVEKMDGAVFPLAWTVSATITVRFYKPMSRSLYPSLSKPPRSFLVQIHVQILVAFFMLHAKMCHTIIQNLYKSIPRVWLGQLRKYSRYSRRWGYQIPQAKTIPKKIFHHVRGIPGIMSEGTPYIETATKPCG